jgi:superfamily II DNA or RNA helicase
MPSTEILITVRNSYSYLSKAFNSLDQRLQNKFIKHTSYQKKGRFNNYTEIYLFTKKVVDQTFDRYYQFPTGLIYRVLKFFQEHSIRFRIEDLRGSKAEIVPLEDFYRMLAKVDSKIEKRDYQIEAIERALKRGRGIINHSTASGKTLGIAGIVYCLNVKTLILCIGKTHIDQMSRDMEKYTGRKVSIITAGHCNDIGPVVVANVQALAAIKKRDVDKYKTIMRSFKCVISDECHFLSSTTFKEVFYYAINAYYKFGFSGTVYREDGAVLEIIGAVGPIISKIGYDFLTRENFISPARFIFMDPMCDFIYEDEDVWPLCLYLGIVENEKRNKWLSHICQAYSKRGKQILVLTPLRTKHGKILEQIIPDSKFLFGESSSYYRKEILAEFESKNFTVLIASTIFDLVINLPDLRCIVMAGGGKAHNAVYQRIGRGIRRSEGKTHVDVVIPWDSHSSVLLRHSKRILSLVKRVDVWEKNIKFVGDYRKKYEG